MKTVINIVRVTCLCGWHLTIYGAGMGVSVGRFCWKCGRFVYHVLSGNRAIGKVVDNDDSVKDTFAKLLGREDEI